MPAISTIGMADAKTNFSRITANVNKTGIPVTVFKNNKPWVEIRPLASDDNFSTLPNGTKEAILETEKLLNDPSRVTFKTAEELFSSLGV